MMGTRRSFGEVRVPMVHRFRSYRFYFWSHDDRTVPTPRQPRNIEMRRMVNLAAMAAVVTTLVVAGGALATSGSGVLAAQVLARSAFIDDVDLKVRVQTDGATKVATVGRFNRPVSGSGKGR